LLCDSVILCAQRFSRSIQAKAELIRRRYSVLFELFEKCHSIYDKCLVTDGEIRDLGKVNYSQYSNEYNHKYIQVET